VPIDKKEITFNLFFHHPIIFLKTRLSLISLKRFNYLSPSPYHPIMLKGNCIIINFESKKLPIIQIKFYLSQLTKKVINQFIL
jgi:hypothetical protein